MHTYCHRIDKEYCDVFSAVRSSLYFSASSIDQCKAYHSTFKTVFFFHNAHSAFGCIFLISCMPTVEYFEI
jgi:hypothetical protein